MSILTITEDTIKEMIELLQLEEKFTVAELLKRINISKTKLYGDFGHLLPKKGKDDTEELIIYSIRLLQARTGRKKLTINEVVEESGLGRTTVSQNYKELHCYIYGKKDLPPLKNQSVEVELESELKLLKDKINTYDHEKSKEIEDIKNNTYSSLMKLDLAHYKSESTTTSIHNIQTQANEFKRMNQELANKNASLRSRIVALEEKTSLSSNVDLLDHIKPKYDLVIKAMKAGAEKKEINKLFREQENEYLQKAITRVNDLSPDIVIFFQPFFSSSFESVPLTVSTGSVVIVESNVIKSDIRRDFCELINSQTMAIYSRSSLNRTKHFCRTNGLSFNDMFIEHYYEFLNFPDGDEGFDSIMYFKPKN
ncbi:MAG: hypothetical protein ACPG5R_03170 [Cognaticolwellia aestuarii]